MKTKHFFNAVMAALIAVIFSVLTGCATDGGSKTPVPGTPADPAAATPAEEQPGPAPGSAITWTVADSPFPARDKYDDENIVRSVVYGGSKFIAWWYNARRVAYSMDGVTWTALPDNSFSDRIRAVAYGGDKFVAAAGNSTFYSADGLTWTKSERNATGGPWVFCITYGDGKFVAGADWWANGVSVDGVTWSEEKNDNPVNPQRAIAYGNGKFIAVGSDDDEGGRDGDEEGGGRMAYSTDGVTWTGIEQNIFVETVPIAIAYGNGKFVAVGGWMDGGQMAYSTDGVTWAAIEQSIFGEGDPLRGIAYGGGKFVAVGGWDGKMAYSADGVTWTAVEDSPTSNRGIFGIAYGNGRFVAALGEDKIAYSNNQE